MEWSDLDEACSLAFFRRDDSLRDASWETNDPAWRSLTWLQHGHCVVHTAGAPVPSTSFAEEVAVELYEVVRPNSTACVVLAQPHAQSDQSCLCGLEQASFVPFQVPDGFCVYSHGRRCSVHPPPHHQTARPSLNLATISHPRHNSSLGSCLCPSFQISQLSPPPQLTSRFPFVRLGIAVLLTDASSNVLLTRRASTMRTFPSAWVMPGGHIEAGERLHEAGARELFEETGLTCDLSSMRLLGMWESNFPTTVQGCIDAGQIKGHHLVVYFTAKLAEEAHRDAITLQEAETDCAVWVSPESLTHVISPDNIATVEQANLESLPKVPGEIVVAAGPAIDGSVLCGIYPNRFGQGIAQGHLCMLHKLVEAGINQKL
eukprot:c15988_g1_i1.p1 GENE.c15988_g1_i1~~c15988_g1_i1.p1  ORF type:complete len:374 (+),score=42.99 c15988_g1_i1:28-1149(+)